jgi:hypothetical protein
MGSRIIVCGSVKLSAEAYAKAHDTPLLEMFVVDPDDPDGCSFVPQSMKPDELFSAASHEAAHRAWSRNSYDPVEERWLFGCSFHEDDWWNPKHDLLPGGLARLKDRAGEDVILAYEEGSKKLDSVWKVDEGRWSHVDPMPELPDALATLIADRAYTEALAEVQRLVRQGA